MNKAIICLALPALLATTFANAAVAAEPVAARERRAVSLEPKPSLSGIASRRAEVLTPAASDRSEVDASRTVGGFVSTHEETNFLAGLTGINFKLSAAA